MKKKNISILLNGLIILFTIIGIIFMILGINFMGKSKLLIANNISVLKFFTVDSNILIGLTSLIYLLSKKKSTTFLSILKLVATTSITLTFLVTALYLVPMNFHLFFDFYKNSNLFFHLITPILSIITYLFFDEVKKIKKSYLTWNLLPVFLYSNFYLTNVLTHMKKNKISYEYDFYGFMIGGIKSIIIVIPLILFLTFFIGLLLNKYKKI